MMRNKWKEQKMIKHRMRIYIIGVTGVHNNAPAIKYRFSMGGGYIQYGMPSKMQLLISQNRLISGIASIRLLTNILDFLGSRGFLLYFTITSASHLNILR